MKLFSWGTNSHGQLGLGYESEIVQIPTPVPIDHQLIDLMGASIAGGGNHTLILTKIGQVFGAGLDYSGQLCSTGGSSTFIPLKSVLSTHCQKVCAIACGWDFSLFISDTGSLYGCGSNKFEQLGSSIIREKVLLSEIPIEPENQEAAHISAGLRHCVALTTQGSLHIWGAKKYVDKNQSTGLGADISKIACGQNHIIVVDTKGNMFAWGSNNYGQCGKDSTTAKVISRPTVIDWDTGNNGQILDIVSGWSHSLLLTDSGFVYSFGRNTYGQLGRPLISKTCDHSPQRVVQLEGIVSIAAGSEHSMALDRRGQLWTWGWNEHGSCGNGDLVNQLLPVNISNNFPRRVLSIGCGAGQCFAVVDD